MKLPLKVVGRNDPDAVSLGWEFCSIYDADGNDLITTANDGCASDPSSDYVAIDPAIAADIVTACNEFPALVACCRELITFADKNNTINLNGHLSNAVLQARALLARLEPTK